MLDRGFTTVRDVGGGDAGHKRAQAEGMIRGPRLFVAGKALGQTGGHTDFRGTSRADIGDGHRRHIPSLGRIVDGVPECLAAARDELRLGADLVKIMANGGVATPADPIDWIQFTPEEIRAIVSVAEASCTYVAAHTYTARAIEHAATNGVRTLEHCNLIDDRVAGILAERGCFAVPTLVIYDCLERHADAIGLGAANRAKNRLVREAGLASLEILARAGVPMGYGTDLLGWMHRDQLAEFGLRAQVLTGRGGTAVGHLGERGPAAAARPRGGSRRGDGGPDPGRRRPAGRHRLPLGGGRAHRHGGAGGRGGEGVAARRPAARSGITA